MKYTISFSLSVLLFALAACSSESAEIDATTSALVEDMGDEEVGESEASSAVDDVIDDAQPGMLCDEDRIRLIAERLVEKRESYVETRENRGGKAMRKMHRKKVRHKVRHSPVRRAITRVLFSYDADGEGLSDEELDTAVSDIAACCESRKALLLEAFDTDDDGALDEDERAALREDRRTKRQERVEARREEILSSYDLDGDGALSREERREARQARLAELGIDPSDGISEDEKAAFRAAVQERFDAFCSAETF